MDEELGIKADRKITSEITKELSAKWHFKNNPPQNPTVLAIGGFQGSGKTTILDLLQKDLDLIVISPDEIRHELFEKGWKVNEQFIHTVNATRNNLLKKALSLGYNIAVDQLTTSTRINLIKEILNENNVLNYRFLSIYLKASKEALINRVSSRRELPGRYRGTVDELEASMKKYGEQNLSIYDHILDSEKLNPKQIAEKIKTLLC